MTGKVIITGATGWLGQEYLYRRYLMHSKEGLGNFILLGSKSRTINLFGLIPTKVWSLDEIDIREKIDGVIHLAFVLRHRVKEFGTDKFLELNSSIVEKTVRLIDQVKPDWITCVSSGAIFDRTTGEYERNPKANPYGFGKFQEELALSSIAASNNTTLVIGRLWGASGFCMPPNSAYALSDFIESALHKGEIQINSNFEVYRRYCDAGEFLELLTKEASSGNSAILNSGGPLHEIGEIAEMIQGFIENTAIRRPIIIGEQIDDYYPRETSYEDLAIKHGIQLASMQTQIRRTVLGHRNFLQEN